MSNHVSGKNPFPPQYPLSSMVFTDPAAFNIAAGFPAVAVTFEEQPAGADITGLSTCGVKFDMIRAPLVVTSAEATRTPLGFQGAPEDRELKLESTSGGQLLSPGGTELAPGSQPILEDDDVILRFNPPVACVGFDVCPQWCDGMSNTRIEVRDPHGVVLYEGELPISDADLIEGFVSRVRLVSTAPRHSFWGIVSDQRNIAWVQLDERDDNDSPADSNLGIDTLRFAPSDCGRRGDLSGDGHVDSSDIVILVALLGECSPGRVPAVEWCPADFDRDGSIDGEDLIALMACAR